MKQQLLFLACCLLVANVHAADTKMTKNMLVVAGEKYRTKKAEDATVASMGVMSTPLGGVFAFEHKYNSPKRLNVPITKPQMIDLKDIQITKGAEKGKISIPLFGKISSKKLFSGLKYGQYKLLKLKVLTGPYKDRLNKDKAFLRKVREQKPKDKVRIVTAVWIVIQAEFGKKITKAINDKAEFNIKGIDFNIDWAAAKTKDVKVSLAPGSVFAYEVSKVIWTNKREKIRDLKPDKAGILR